MNTPEWLTLIGILIAGFAWVSKLLEKIHVSLANSVTHEQCAEKREKCPCVKEMELFKTRRKYKR